MADSMQAYKPHEENENVEKMTSEFSDKVEVSECKRDELHKEDEKEKQDSVDEEEESVEKETAEKPNITEDTKETVAGENKDEDGEEANYEDAKSHDGDDDRREEDGGGDDIHKGLVDSIKEKLPIDGKKDAGEAEKPEAAAADVDYGGKEKKGLVGKMKEKIAGVIQPKANTVGLGYEDEGDREQINN